MKEDKWYNQKNLITKNANGLTALVKKIKIFRIKSIVKVVERKIMGKVILSQS